MKNNYLLFFILSSCVLILSHISKEILNTENILIKHLSEELTYKEISNYLYEKSNWEYLSYILIPILLLFKVFIISAILDIGCFFFGENFKYKKLLNIVIKSEFLFLLVIILKTIWFYFFQPNYSFTEFQYFYPLSALNIVGFQNLETWFIYPLQAINLFEFFYWIMLAYLIHKEINITFKKGIFIVSSSYGVALFIWVIGVMFLTLNLS